MTQWHRKSNRKMTGGKLLTVRRCDKQLAWKGGDFSRTTVEEEERRKTVKTRGTTEKVRQTRAKTATVNIPSQKKTVKADIISVEKNDANGLYTRKNIITKGASLKVKIDGKEQIVKVTSRPGQHGVVQAVLEKQ